MENSRRLLGAIAAVGRQFPAQPEILGIEPLRSYCDASGPISGELDRRDGSITRREAITRFLLLSAVLDQGPDIDGVRELIATVTNDLYRREVRYLHTPIEFFEDIHLSADQIESVHEAIKQVRAAAWANRNDSNPDRYLLYMDNSKQTLAYAVFRWGVPLLLPHILTREAEALGQGSEDVLVKHLRSYDSTEQMTKGLKDHSRYGLGKAIGDKAAHLFGKWVVHSYSVLSSASEPGWGSWSYEIPFDSNAGRVLYRTGFLTDWLSRNELLDKEVLQPGKGKGGTTYMRVTNLREIGVDRALAHPELVDSNRDLCVNHIKSHNRAPRKIEIQRLPSAISLLDQSFAPGHLDDGLIKIGTTWCLNLEKPRCESCPIRGLCKGALSDPDLIAEVRT